MAHEITIRQNGFAEAAFRQKPAWHELGTVFDADVSYEEMLLLAGLDWEVIQRQMGIAVPRTIETPEGPVESVRWEEIPEALANVRSDTGMYLGNVSPQYVVVQNREAFAFMDALVEEGRIRWETAFSLNGGKKVICTAKLPRIDTVLDGDTLERYVLCGLGHDGTGAINFGLTSTRVVCANTYRIALGEGGIREMSIRHTGDLKEKLHEARRILQLANDQFDKYADQSAEMVDRQLTSEQWYEILDILCPLPNKNDPDWSERRQAAIEETRSNIDLLYQIGDRCNLPGMESTAWAAFNAVTEHIDHLPRRGANRQRRAEARFNVTLYGAGRDMKERAWHTVRNVAGLVA